VVFQLIFNSQLISFFKLPEGLKENLAAPLLCAGVTVHAPLKRHLKEGDKVAVNAIGGLGHLAVQYAAKLGHEVLAITSSTDKNDLIYSLGAKHIISLKDENALKEHSGKYDVIINTNITYDGIDKLFVLCAREGTIIQVGAADISEKLSDLPVMAMITKEINFTGSGVGCRGEVKAMLEDSVKLDVYPMVEEYSWEDFPKALNRLENERPKFRCVVNVKDTCHKK